ncbi:gamma-glutamylcyclotransferase [Paraburkholderia panacisoli]|uniref:glutathione-specific gamma-glutamylcyclotransferase n=2 Tax=Paraburkholderia panacisoli TaxID=2603818 RepID=A0A5B0HHG8_9BURK|nr:gamma-glutamylcyclotransferase [Paraburkholderia panacisoli]
MQGTLARRPKGPVWLFAYGSLIWNPLFEFSDSRRATLDGWHRSFCIRLVAGRGNVEHPGRMLALEAGGRTEGLAFMLHEAGLERELGIVWMREMIGGVYQPKWERIAFEGGDETHAIVFVVDEAHPLYETDSSVGTTAPIVARAAGHLGRNVDYAMRLSTSLAEHGMTDAYVDDLVAAMRAAGENENNY